MSSKYPRLERRGIFKGAFAINGGVGKNHFKNYIHLSLND
jgi:hypothetical protein